MIRPDIATGTWIIMPEWQDEAIVLAVRPHGETAAIVTLLTCHHGRHAGLVRGGQSRQHKAVLQPGNLVIANWRARLEDQLGSLTIELETAMASRVLDDPKRLAGLAACCAVIEGCLPEREPAEAVYLASCALIRLIADPDAGLSWLAGYIRWELEMLEIAGFRLSLSRCAISGEMENLAWVSPRSGAAVTDAAAGAYSPRLLALPGFLGGVARSPEQDLVDGLRLTGYFLDRQVFGQHHQPLPAARQRLGDLVRTLAPPPPEPAASVIIADAENLQKE